MCVCGGWGGGERDLLNILKKNMIYYVYVHLKHVTMYEDRPKSSVTNLIAVISDMLG